MLDIAWPELVVIGAVALVAIGPKDLPKVMRMAGQWVGKARHMMQDVQRSFDQLNYETEIAERLQKEAKAAAENPTPGEPPKPPNALPPVAPPLEAIPEPPSPEPPSSIAGHDRTDS